MNILIDNHPAGDVYKRLVKLNKASAENFLVCYEKLEITLEQSDLALWVEIFQSLATNGWHGWQSANAYGNLVTLNIKNFHRYNLIDRGRCGLTFGLISQQPPLAYFDGLTNLIGDGGFPSVKLLEHCGRILQEKYPQASNLLLGYFEAAFVVSADNDTAGFESWNQIIIQLSEDDRKQTQEFIQLSNKYASNNWTFLSSIYSLNPSFCHSYIENYQSFSELIIGLEDQFELIVFDTLNSGGEDWVNAFVQQAFNHAEVRLLLSLLENVSQSCHVIALIETIKKLPQNTTSKLKEWAKAGHRIAEVNSLGAIAFFKLESKYSVNFLDQIMGWLRFSKNKRVLQLYSQCLSDYPLEIIGLDANELHCEGLSIFLPELVDIYASKMDNFSWLKVALSHQVAGFEYGSYEFKFENSPHPYMSFFHSFDNPQLARILFEILEGARIDWKLEFMFQGLKTEIQKLKKDASVLEKAKSTDKLLRLMLLYSLDDVSVMDVDSLITKSISDHISPLKLHTATVFDTAKIVTDCYKIVEESKPVLSSYGAVTYRGKKEWDSTVRLTPLELELEVETEEDIDKDLDLSMPGLPENAEIDNFLRGKLPQSKSQEVMDVPIDGVGETLEKLGTEIVNWRSQAKGRKEKESVYKYDEWDYQIGDYRNAWCTLYEVETSIQDAGYVADTMSELSSVANEVKRQLNKLRPELARKVRGVPEGEDLDLDRAIEAMIDKRSGLSPSENIYIQQQKKQRDVSALFLIDLSASTDDYIEGISMQEGRDTRKKIIDLEKQAVILMTEGLKNLGDKYAVCGFSGYGRDRVDFVVCKGFDEVYGEFAKSKIGGLKPMRSTRMGPAIRHAGKMLQATESKIKALIIISDGYPQDFDYGADRSDKTYGIRDTTKALVEMSDEGVQSFCLTVDPSGHDYLREMCPEKQYMVIQDISQLPTELSKIYRGLTS